MDSNFLAPSFVPVQRMSSESEKPPAEIPLILPGTNVTLDSATAVRPKADGITFPFKLGHSLMDQERNASMVTLKSNVAALPSPRGESGEGEKGLGSALKHEAVRDEGEGEKTIEGDKAYRQEVGMGDGESKEATRTEDAKAPQRPGVERFETAREDLD